MVNSRILSKYGTAIPLAGESRKIAHGPLYSLEDVQLIAGQADTVRLWTRKCEVDTRNLGLDAEAVAEWLMELKPTDYRDSEWCINNVERWVACDAYTLVRREWIKAANKWMEIEYFLKFAVSKSGTLVLMVSCHP